MTFRCCREDPVFIIEIIYLVLINMQQFKLQSPQKHKALKIISSTLFLTFQSNYGKINFQGKFKFQTVINWTAWMNDSKEQITSCEFVFSIYASYSCAPLNSSCRIYFEFTFTNICLSYHRLLALGFMKNRQASI